MKIIEYCITKETKMSIYTMNGKVTRQLDG